jgi:heat shock protein HslJ
MRSLIALLPLMLVPALAGGQDAAAPVTIPVPVKAVGHEPEWTLDIGPGRLTFIGAATGERVEVPLPPAASIPGGQRFDGKSEAHALSAVVTATRCIDSMSGLPRPYSVSVTVDGRALQGCAGDATMLLRGGLWVVESVQGVTTVAKSLVTLAFAPGGRLEGSTGCNRYVSSYVLTGEQLQLTMPISTMRACAPPLMQQERAFLDVLRGVQRFAFEADGALVLTDGDGGSLRARR